MVEGSAAQESGPGKPLIDDAKLDQLERYCTRPAYPLMSIRAEEVAALVAEIRRLRRRLAEPERADLSANPGEPAINMPADNTALPEADVTR